MYALLGIDNKTVINIYPPDVSKEIIDQERGDLQVIKITIENSPCYLHGWYEDGIFYPPKK
jgi:hypothetical protein